MSDKEKQKRGSQSSSETILIKKYPNRRLYNTSTSGYIVLDDIVELVKSDTPFIIQDKKTGEDITRSILNQIIFDRETSNLNSHYHFPLEVQKQLIGMYDDAYSQMVPDFLKQSLSMFKDEQSKMQASMKDFADQNSKMVMDMTSNMAKHNMELFKKSMDMFTSSITSNAPTDNAATEQADASGEKQSQLDEIQEQINALQERLKELK